VRGSASVKAEPSLFGFDSFLRQFMAYRLRAAPLYQAPAKSGQSAVPRNHAGCCRHPRASAAAPGAASTERRNEVSTLSRDDLPIYYSEDWRRWKDPECPEFIDPTRWLLDRHAAGARAAKTEWLPSGQEIRTACARSET